MPMVTGVLRRGLVVRSNLGDGTLRLLHIDDSPNDRLLVKVAISQTKTPFIFYEADGLETAMPYFRFHQYDGENLHPALVLLDYDMGKTTGADFLYWLRVTRKITSIPVVMLSGSVGGPHVAECYAAGANHFISKPVDLSGLKVIIRTLHMSMPCNGHGPIAFLQEYQPDPRAV
jgi:two-component system, chemotaxis family, response regulator Rcp1